MVPTDGSVRLLDIVPELASHLREDERREAHAHLVAPTRIVPTGRWSTGGGPAHDRAFGLLVVRGVLLHEVTVGRRRALLLLGPGDLVFPEAHEGETLDARVEWTAASECCLALLDDRVPLVVARWPGLAIGLLERAGRQLRRLAIQAAVAQLPRVEDRIEATFWDLADRWGRVTPSGIHIPLSLTHAALGRLVGARRSTVTLALHTLDERGVVVRRPDRGWLLVGSRPSAALEGDAALTVDAPRFRSERPVFHHPADGRRPASATPTDPARPRA